MHVFRGIAQLLILGVCCIGNTSCMVGPNFKTLRAPKVNSYLANPLPNKTVKAGSLKQAGKPQYFAYNMDIKGEWWELFHSKALNELIVTGLKNSPNLAASYANLRVAQEALNAGTGNLLFPAFDAVGGGTRTRSSATSFGSSAAPTIFNVFNTSVNVSYTFDVFGGNRRQLEALKAQVDFAQFELIATHLTLTTNIVTTVVTKASLIAQRNATIALIQAQEQQLMVLKKQFELGGVSRETVLTQQTLVEQTRATLPVIEKNLAQTSHALTVLIGLLPNQTLPEITLKELTLPAVLPVSLPSHLVRQRPDVRAQEALVHAASAEIGVATANLLPQFNLTGGYGWQALALPKLFGTETKVWNVAGQITQPIFHGGALFATRRQAIAAYDAAMFQYKQTVLQAFQNVADTLRAIELDASALKAQRAAEVAAFKNLHLTQEQYRLGGVSFLNVLNAEQQYQTTVIARIQATALRYNDTAALFQALGGGWWHHTWCVQECLYG